MKLSLRYYKTNLLIATILALAFGIDMSFELIQNYFDQHTDFILRAPTNAAIITSLLVLYDRYLWRYPVLNKLINVPNLNGRYVGCIEYEWDGTSEEMECTVEIIQTASSIQIQTYFKSEKHENTYSQSLVEDIRFEKGQYSIYFIGDEDEDERKSIQTYHNWIYEAVDGHTSQKPIDKNTCVRVTFSDGHNIDLPIYYKKGTTPELAHKGKRWIFSDPKEFIEWFEEKAKGNPQLRRIIRYLKAWCDYREFSNSSKKMPSGFIMTILAANHQYKHDRDDVALKETLVNIQAELSREFKCKRPTTPEGEDLLEEYSQEDYFMNELVEFIGNAKRALEVKSQKKACEYWQKIFGNRFSCSNAIDEDKLKNKTSALAAGAFSSRPWVR